MQHNGMGRDIDIDVFTDIVHEIIVVMFFSMQKPALTLAEMFEQIKQCRYIRYYHPYGAKSDDEDDSN